MKNLMYYLKLVTPALLVIFILGGKPAKVKGQEPEKKEKKTYAIKVIKDENGEKVVYDTSFTWDDKEGMEHILADLDLEDCGEDGDMKLIVKKDKECESEADVYIIKSASSKDKKRKKK